MSVPSATAQVEHVPWGSSHPILSLVARRVLLGILTLFLVSVLVFLATQVLPGDATTAVLGRSATPERVTALQEQLHLNQSVAGQYWTWLSGLLTGDLGNSLANGLPVWDQVAPRLVNSAILVFLAGLIGSLLGIALGAAAAVKRDRWFDHTSSIIALAVTALPEFVVAITLVILFSTVVFHLLPAVSLLTPGSYSWSDPEALLLPVASLVIVIVPYIFRMTRAAMIEALQSDYVEMAHLKGVPSVRIIYLHVFPNSIAPVIQVIGLTFLYLAGGIVVIEYVFNYPGIGQGLVNAVSDRDIPVIQFIVVILASFYVAMNVLTDVIALWATPRRRTAR